MGVDCGPGAGLVGGCAHASAQRWQAAAEDFDEAHRSDSLARVERLSDPRMFRVGSCRFVSGYMGLSCGPCRFVSFASCGSRVMRVGICRLRRQGPTRTTREPRDTKESPTRTDTDRKISPYSPTRTDTNRYGTSLGNVRALNGMTPDRSGPLRGSGYLLGPVTPAPMSKGTYWLRSGRRESKGTRACTRSPPRGSTDVATTHVDAI